MSVCVREKEMDIKKKEKYTDARKKERKERKKERNLKLHLVEDGHSKKSSFKDIRRHLHTL